MDPLHPTPSAIPGFLDVPVNKRVHDTIKADGRAAGWPDSAFAGSRQLAPDLYTINLSYQMVAILDRIRAVHGQSYSEVIEGIIELAKANRAQEAWQ